MYLRILFSCSSLTLLLCLGCAVAQVEPPPDVDGLAPSTEVTPIQLNLPNTMAQLIDSSPAPTTPGTREERSNRNILVLSAGGRDGAYTAGVLVGWSATGTRPTFDVVTGISTGALIAPMAFLGKDYDRLLMESFTTIRTENIYRKKPLMTVLWSESLADTAPLRRRIDEHITDNLLAEIALAHREGRRLYVGTTNLSTGRLTVWDLGAIAAGPAPNKRELFRNVILASCSIPGLFPPVPIEIEVNGQHFTELHADGAITASLFLHPVMIADKSGDWKSNVYAIIAGKLSSGSRALNRCLISQLSASLQEMLESRTKSDLLRVFLLTRLSGGRFAVTSIPQDVAVDPDVTRFDPAEMQQLFDSGYNRAITGWRSTPPGVNPEEWLVPRTGTIFKTDQ